MSHLHLPDGVLTPWLWVPALGLAVLLLLHTGRALRFASPQQVAYRSALGALMLAAMAVQIPLGPFEYHLSLLGPIGVLLGPSGAYQAVFVASAILAFVGHGGLTVVGLNALVLGAGTLVARPVFTSVARVRGPVASMAAATAAAQAAAGILWLAVVLAALRFGPEGTAFDARRAGWAVGLALPIAAVGLVVETGIGAGIARFLARVRPDLLPAAGSPQPLAERIA